MCRIQCQCGENYHYNDDQDSLEGGEFKKEVSTSDVDGRSVIVTMWFCECRAVICTTVLSCWGLQVLTNIAEEN